MPPAKKPTAIKPARKRKTPAKKKAAPKQTAGDATRARRLEHKRRAAEALEKHSGPVLNLLADVVHDLAEENEGLSRVEEDLALASELAFRIDRALVLKDPLLEALDGLIALLVAGVAVAVYRSIERRSRMQGKRLDRLRKKLEDRGPLMSKLARERLEKRIARLAAK